MARIFISYRRADSAADAFAIRTPLRGTFGNDVLFFDFDSLRLGDKFRQTIASEVSKIDVLIAIIGKQWLNITNETTGKRRLLEPDDILRMEIATALKRDINIIPVVVGGATMPSKDQLPDDLQPLCDHNACYINYGGNFDHEVGKLIDHIREILKINQESQITPSIPSQGTLDIKYPGNIFWLAHNIEHVRLRLIWLWPKDQVINMLDNCIHHATQAHFPKADVNLLRNLRQIIEQNPQDKTQWDEHARHLDFISRRMANIAENSHPNGHQFMLPPNTI